jgi:hypothetical protein
MNTTKQLQLKLNHAADLLQHDVTISSNNPREPVKAHGDYYFAEGKNRINDNSV